MTLQNVDGDSGALATFTSASQDGFLGAYVFDGVGVEVVAIGPASVDGEDLAQDIVSMLRSIRPVEGSAS